MCDINQCDNEATKESDDYGALCDECFKDLCLYIDSLHQFTIDGAITDFMNSTKLGKSNMGIYLSTIFKEKHDAM
jgi:hypothetical protein